MAFIFHTDPGHGWLQVNHFDLQSLGMRPTDFSRYSYRQGVTYFLEEDCDASKFVEAYERKHGKRPDFQERYAARTFIRQLQRIW